VLSHFRTENRVPLFLKMLQPREALRSDGGGAPNARASPKAVMQ
jgi:hypothetical protein